MTKTLMVQGTSSGAGKTTLVTALCRIFSDKGFKVAPFKSQNMSNYSYKTNDFEISQAQAIQAIAARTEITPLINPVLLKPLGNYRSSVIVNGKFFKKMSAKSYYENFALKQGLRIALDSLSALKSDHDLIVIEGAGSPAEINMQKYDIANMRVAQKTKSPVLLVADIEKGGVFASLVGTMYLLPKTEQKLIKGFVINKFRGDVRILRPGLSKLEKITNKNVIGILPLLEMDLPNEDSLDNRIHLFRKQNKRKLDKEINKLAKTVKKHIDIKAIERMMG
ncbi:MAG TPA: cobyric acid synthase [Candidatus Nitrosotenuis sp.]|nr:cobyric acid synthase [Candidatus Nitrosotenuis sp.]